MKKNAKTEKVQTLTEVKQNNPELLKPSQLASRNMPPVPRAKDAPPVMNLVTSKNFVVANAVETILAAPKKVSEGTKDYLSKEDYGKVPRYLTQIKNDIEAEYDYIRQLQQQEDHASRSMVHALDEEERQSLIAGLK